MSKLHFPRTQALAVPTYLASGHEIRITPRSWVLSWLPQLFTGRQENKVRIGIMENWLEVGYEIGKLRNVGVVPGR